MKADNLSLSKVFSSGGDIHYVLPHFQREYSWRKEHWETLWKDVLAVYDELQPDPAGGFGGVEHFMGSIVVVHDGMRAGTLPAFKLVDGQQRLTTASLLLRALGIATASTRPDLAKRVEKLLTNPDEKGDVFFKLLPTVKYGDRATYCAIVRGEPPPASQSLVPEAFHYFKGEVAGALSAGADPERLLHVILHAFQVVFVNLDQSESPYRIFESLNGKGKALTPADLVRNYVAMRLPTARQEHVFTKHWMQIETLLQEGRYVGKLTELTAFLRHYLAMRTGNLCDESHVYARFRDRCEREAPSPAQFEAELAELAQHAVQYDRLLRPDHMPDRAMGIAMSRLNAMEASSAYPFLLHVLASHAAGEIISGTACEILASIENFMVRRYLTRQPANSLNKVFPQIWAQLDRSNPGQSLRTALASRGYPTNAKVIRGVLTESFYEGGQNRRRTALILETLNRRLSDGTGGYTVLDAAPTIEHVMPQKLTDEWKTDIGLMWEQVHGDLLDTLGNLTLVTGVWNSELQNARFTVKRPKLGANALRLNSTYFTEAMRRWGREEIRERGETLAGQILEVWPSFIPNDSATEAMEDHGSGVTDASEFHFEILERAAVRIGAPMLRLSQARFESSDGRHRLIGLCSKPYPRAGNANRYWYGLRPSHKDFLDWSGGGWIAFECAPHRKALLIPFADLQPWLHGLRETEGRHWHVELFEQGDSILLPLSLTGEKIDVSKYRI